MSAFSRKQRSSTLDESDNLGRYRSMIFQYFQDLIDCQDMASELSFRRPLHLVPFRGIDVGGESEPFRVSSTLPPNSITRETITYFVDDQGHRLLTKCR